MCAHSFFLHGHKNDRAATTDTAEKSAQNEGTKLWRPIEPVFLFFNYCMRSGEISYGAYFKYIGFSQGYPPPPLQRKAANEAANEAANKAANKAAVVKSASFCYLTHLLFGFSCVIPLGNSTSQVYVLQFCRSESSGRELTRDPLSSVTLLPSGGSGIVNMAYFCFLSLVRLHVYGAFICACVRASSTAVLHKSSCNKNGLTRIPSIPIPRVAALSTIYGLTDVPPLRRDALLVFLSSSSRILQNSVTYVTRDTTALNNKRNQDGLNPMFVCSYKLGKQALKLGRSPSFV
ncbi:hypothetical protein POVWA1_045230 [Plasmodium ovale wallikeri]|uniref:Uncharacterized protein n=1 Tax=Plasmodium ovale wallikeri TaxID=864142 RepID=A0A1A8ZE34_PLAOA|nr:hypothetical protein POVWA1_045230 [Plasmodium ovale wallikeri]